MTADEALALSPTGFVWDDDGRPLIMVEGYWVYLCYTSATKRSLANCHPLPPSLREQQGETPSTEQYQRAQIDALKEELTAAKNVIALLTKKIESEKPKLKRRPLSQKPRAYDNVLIWVGDNLMGCGLVTNKEGWAFYFAHCEEHRDSYTWTELPEVE